MPMVNITKAVADPGCQGACAASYLKKSLKLIVKFFKLEQNLKLTRALDRGVFYASKMPKTHWR
jgi:hypothetical protein